MGNSRYWQAAEGNVVITVIGAMAVAAAMVSLASQFSGLLGLPPLPDLGPGLFPRSKDKKKKVRVYMDGCFDMMHYGHANALRQARALGDELVVGVVSDEEIKANKGPPVMSMDERVVMVSSVKWVDEVIEDAPYAINEEFMNKLFTDYRIDYIIHGDDPCLLPDGTDAYAHAKKAGRYKQIKRTEGVSSTDIVVSVSYADLLNLRESQSVLQVVDSSDRNCYRFTLLGQERLALILQRGGTGRMLLCVRDRPVSETPAHASLQRQFSLGSNDRGSSTVGAATRVSHFLPTSRRIVQFSNGRGPPPDAKIVYMDGAFDLFHAGHVETLKAAREMGDFLLVGIHNDQIVSGHRGAHHPIMHVHERSLSVLACRYVDEVIIGAPWEVSKDMITTFNMSLVVHGTCAEVNDMKNGEADPYAAAKELGLFIAIKSPRNITTSTIIRRILSNHEAFKKRNEKKVESENKYYQSKTYVNGD